jgi:hypothetical protein
MDFGEDVRLGNHIFAGPAAQRIGAFAFIAGRWRAFRRKDKTAMIAVLIGPRLDRDAPRRAILEDPANATFGGHFVIHDGFGRQATCRTKKASRTAVNRAPDLSMHRIAGRSHQPACGHFQD